MSSKKWNPIPRVAKLGMAGFVVAVLFLGFFIKNRDSYSELFEGVVDWGPMRTALYPGGDCLAPYYEYIGSENASADLNVRREQTGKPHALWVKFRGQVSVVGSDSRLGGEYMRQLRSTEIIETRAAQGCTR